LRGKGPANGAGEDNEPVTASIGGWFGNETTQSFCSSFRVTHQTSRRKFRRIIVESALWRETRIAGVSPAEPECGQRRSVPREPNMYEDLAIPQGGACGLLSDGQQLNRGKEHSSSMRVQWFQPSCERSSVWNPLGVNQKPIRESFPDPPQNTLRFCLASNTGL